jgi:hypothetical protein
MANTIVSNEKAITVSHIIFIQRQFSNAWLKKCSCGEVFTGKGQSEDVKTLAHIREAN